MKTETGTDAREGRVRTCAYGSSAGTETDSVASERKKKGKEKQGSPNQIAWMHLSLYFMSLLYVHSHNPPSHTHPANKITTPPSLPPPLPPTRAAPRPPTPPGRATRRLRRRSGGFGRAGAGSGGRWPAPNARTRGTVIFVIFCGFRDFRRVIFVVVCWSGRASAAHVCAAGGGVIMTQALTHTHAHTSSSHMAISTSAAPSPQKTALARLAPCTPTATRAPGRRATAAAMPVLGGLI